MARKGEITEKQTTIYQWKCPCNGCGRILSSMYKKQLVSWAQAHLSAHQLSEGDDIVNITEVLKGGEK